MNVLEILAEMMNHFGYFGILAAVGMEYACFPISSEILLPFIGYTVAKGNMELLPVIFISAIGGIVGSSFCFCIGRFCGDLIDKTICRKFHAAEIGINQAKNYFKRHGGVSVLIGRIFPIVRTYISIPAGMSHMAFSTFITYTGIGALVWNTMLISAGYFLGEHWQEAKEIVGQYQWIFYALLAVGIIVLFQKLWRKKRRRTAKRKPL